MAWCGGGAAASGGVGEEAVRPALSSARRLPARPCCRPKMAARSRGPAPSLPCGSAPGHLPSRRGSGADAREEEVEEEEGPGREGGGGAHPPPLWISTTASSSLEGKEEAAQDAGEEEEEEEEKEAAGI